MGQVLGIRGTWVPSLNPIGANSVNVCVAIFISNALHLSCYSTIVWLVTNSTLTALLVSNQHLSKSYKNPGLFVLAL